MYNYVLAIALITGSDVSHSFFDENDKWTIAEYIRNIAVDWEM